MRGVSRHPVAISVAIALGILAKSNIVGALNEPTHVLVNVAAARYDRFDAMLQQSLGLSLGARSPLRGSDGRLRFVEQWLGEGGAREDDGARFLNHFHDPLQPWDRAGLGAAILRYESSVRWMQRPAESGLNLRIWSWGDARRLYAQALTEPDPLKREQVTADLFRALGQIMHLVVDASTPEHSRNDPHLGGFVERQIFRNPRYGNYEYWVSDQHTLGATPQAIDVSEAQFIALYLSSPLGFDPSILHAPTLDDVASVPIARLIDTTSYRRAGSPNVTLLPASDRPAIGLSEFSNANFFSESSLKDQYPYPVSENLPPSRWATPRGRVRAYFAKWPGDGLAVDPARAECVTDQMAVRIQVPFRCQDENVWRQTAFHMLPRAVGYARGVLDYFFRGSATVTAIEWTRRGIEITVENTGTEPMEGVFEIYARQSPGNAGERRARLATLNGGEVIHLEPGEQWFDEVTVPPDTVPTPAHILVFTGQLGLEQDAVVGQVFTVPYVEVRQTTYDAAISIECARTLVFSNPGPYQKGTTSGIRNEHMRCNWIPSHRIGGTFVTNSATDPGTGRPRPIIDRIEARWLGGRAAGPAPLVVDGVAAPGGTWRRAGNEPDPTSFQILEPIGRDKASLSLLVSYAADRVSGSVDAQLATFGVAISSHSKSMWIDNPKSAPARYLVTSGRSISADIDYNWAFRNWMLLPLFEASTLGGAAIPSDARTSRPFGNVRISEGLAVDVRGYNDAVTDDFEIFTTQQAADDRYAAIEPLLGPHPDGPFFAWEAEIRRVYQPMEREFLRAFVTANLEASRIRLIGQVGGGSQ